MRRNLTAPELGTNDWRINLAVKPKMRTHPYFGNVGIVRRINPKSKDVPETMMVELFSNTEKPMLLDEATDDWVTA